LDNN